MQLLLLLKLLFRLLCSSSLSVSSSTLAGNVGMGNVAASVGFVAWAFAATCVHALFADGIIILLLNR